MKVANPILIPASVAAETCGVSLATWWRWEASGRIPEPVRVGGTTRWRAAELADWCDAGCPCRREWELIHNDGKGGAQ